MKHTTDVCIVGGGPAGMLLALLLAHKGVRVLVLEQHADFSREYRGEVLMPRFVQMYRQIGLENWLFSLPHLKLKAGEIAFHGHAVGEFNFSALAPDVPFAVWMPQTTLLEGLHAKAKTFPTFDIWFVASVKGLLRDGERVRGAKVVRGQETIEVEARVTVGADGRYSAVLRNGGFEMDYEDHRFDILWFTIQKPKDYDNTFRVLLSPKRNVLLLPKFPDAIQVGILTGKGGLQSLKERGIEAVRSELAEMHPLFKETSGVLKDFTAFHPLQAHLHMVKRWAKDGCLLIGDAAHCCSPAGAIGVSMATHSAIMAADVIWRGLSQEEGLLREKSLAPVQAQTETEVRRVHQLQRRLTGGLLNRFLPAQWLLPFVVVILSRLPLLRRVQRELLTRKGPLPISPELVLS